MNSPACKFRWVAALFLCIVGTARGAEPVNHRPRIGLALSGGGARGLAHVGVLRVLEELHVPIDYIAGTSIGAIVGAAYSAGYSPDEIEQFFGGNTWDNVLKDKTDRRNLIYRRKIDHKRYLLDLELGIARWKVKFPAGVVGGHRLSLLLDSTFLRVADIHDFSRLSIPFKAIATDLETSKPMILDHGNLADTVRASAAIPGLFTPVEIDGRLYVDGGSSNNLPVDVVRKMGADIVIAVDISPTMVKRPGLNTLFDVANQMMTAATRSATDPGLAKADVAIVPELGDLGILDFSIGKKTAALGERATRAKSAALTPYAVSAEEYARIRRKRALKPFIPATVRKVEIEGLQRTDTQIVNHHVEIHPGDPFDLELLEGNLNYIHGLGDFERADFTIQNEPAGTDLTLRVQEKSWGPSYMHFGFNLNGEIPGATDANGLVDLNLTRLNRLGGEWRTDLQFGGTPGIFSEFFQPFDYSGLFFAAPHVTVLRTVVPYYQDGQRLATYDLNRFEGGLDIGLQFGKNSEIRLGFDQGGLNTSADTGQQIFPEGTLHTGGFTGHAQLDRLDNIYFPTRGMLGAVDFLMSRSAFGSTNGYTRLCAQWAGFATSGRHTGFVGFDGGTSLHGSIPFYDDFGVGGFLSLSGFHENELRGQHYGVGRAGYLYRLPVSPSFFYDGITVGGWGEAGNAWATDDQVRLRNLKYSGTLAAGFETKLGAIYLAYGQSGLDHREFYVMIGRPFVRSGRFPF